MGRRVLINETTIGENWNAVREEADLSVIDSNLLWGRQLLNAFVFDDLDNPGDKYAGIDRLARDVRERIGSDI